MEGTRHEKAALIVVAYVIGFTTAFIAFGLARMSDSQSPVLFLAAPAVKNDANVHNFSTSVVFGNDGLYTVTKENDRIIAADKEAVGIGGSPEPGFYENIIDAEPSRDGRFVYYCEQLTADAENCDSYVYSLADDVIYRVKMDGNVLYSIVSAHESMWSGESTLVVNGAIAPDPNKPWELQSQGSTESTVEDATIEEEVFVQ